MVVPNSPVDAMVKKGEFELVSDPMEILKELRLMIENIDAPGPVGVPDQSRLQLLPSAGRFPGQGKSVEDHTGRPRSPGAAPLRIHTRPVMEEPTRSDLSK